MTADQHNPTLEVFVGSHVDSNVSALEGQCLSYLSFSSFLSFFLLFPLFPCSLTSFHKNRVRLVLTKLQQHNKGNDNA